MNADRALQVVSGKTPTGTTHELVSDETAREIVRFVAEVAWDRAPRLRSGNDSTASDEIGAEFQELVA